MRFLLAVASAALAVGRRRGSFDGTLFFVRIANKDKSEYVAYVLVQAGHAFEGVQCCENEKR